MNGWRLRKAEDAAGGGIGFVERAQAEALATINAWGRTFARDGGCRAEQMEHDRHARNVATDPGAEFFTRLWRAALSNATGLTFEVVDGTPRAVEFDRAAFERAGGGVQMMRAFAVEARAWKLASRHDRATCEPCRAAWREASAHA